MPSVTPFIVSFDVYGTLVDVRSGSRDAFAAILRAAGAPQLDALEFWEHWEAANIRRYWQPYRPYREICRASLDETFHHFGLRGDPDLIRHYFDAFPRFRRFDDVDETLDRLSGRVRLALVSNIDDDLLAVTELGRRFDVVCTAARARGYKPDGTLFRFLLRHGDVDTTRLLHCGQSQRRHGGRQAARHHGRLDQPPGPGAGLRRPQAGPRIPRSPAAAGAPARAARLAVRSE